MVATYYFKLLIENAAVIGQNGRNGGGTGDTLSLEVVYVQYSSWRLIISANHPAPWFFSIHCICVKWVTQFKIAQSKIGCEFQVQSEIFLKILILFLNILNYFTFDSCL